MNLFLLTLNLALVWAAVRADFSPGNLIFGFVVGFLSLWIIRHRFESNAFRRVFLVARLIGLFLLELVLSSVRVAKDTLSPKMDFKPAIVAVPLDVKSDMEIMVLANLISLTPGTLSVDVSHCRSTLYIHTMDVDDPEDLRREIKEGFERQIMEALG